MINPKRIFHVLEPNLLGKSITTLRPEEWTSRHEKSGREVVYTYKEMDKERAYITAQIKGGPVRLMKHRVKPPMVRRQVEAYFEQEIWESKRWEFFSNPK